MLGYYAQFTALSNLTGQKQSGHTLLLGGLGTHGYEPKVNTLFGFPRSISPGGVIFDIPIAMINLTDGLVPDDNLQYQQQIGQLSSGLEHGVLEQFFSTEDDPADAISTIKALTKANEEGQRIYQMTRENMATTLPNLNVDSQTEAAIEQALLAGLEVIAHTDTVSIPGWSGAGYMVLNPNSGSGAYLISGGANGGWLAIALSALLIVIALFPAVAAFFTPLGVFTFTLVVVILTFANILDSLDGCGGDIGVGAALIGAIIAAIPGEGASLIRLVFQGFIFENGFSAAENAACDLFI